MEIGHVPDYLHFVSEKRDNRWQSTNRDRGVIKENKRGSENGYKGKEARRMNASGKMGVEVKGSKERNQ